MYTPIVSGLQKWQPSKSWLTMSCCLVILSGSRPNVFPFFRSWSPSCGCNFVCSALPAVFMRPFIGSLDRELRSNRFRLHFCQMLLGSLPILFGSFLGSSDVISFHRSPLTILKPRFCCFRGMWAVRAIVFTRRCLNSSARSTILRISKPTNRQNRPSCDKLNHKFTKLKNDHFSAPGWGGERP